METLKFLFLSSFYPPYHLGGDATHVKYLAEELGARGHEVHILHSIDAYKVKRKNSKVTKNDSPKNVFVHEIESKFSSLSPSMAYLIGRSFTVEKRFDKLLKEVSPDVIHYHNISLLGYSVLKKTGPLNLYTAHDYWLICQTNNLMRKNCTVCQKKNCFHCAIENRKTPQLWRHFGGYKKAVQNIDLLISPSEYVRQRIVEEIDVKSCIVPNFAPAPKGKLTDAKYPAPYFLFVGMLEKHKGILNLLEVFKELNSKSSYHLIIAGGGGLTNEIKAFIEKNSLNEKIQFLGFVSQDELYSLYFNAAALIVPSIWPENAPLVTLEAVSLGTPIIVSKMGGLPEIATKLGLDKLIFSSFDDLKNILTSFKSQEYNREAIKRRYTESFSVDAYVKSYMKILEENLCCLDF
jgi:glycosyltransferase involved in cell wall biosynthesis